MIPSSMEQMRVLLHSRWGRLLLASLLVLFLLLCGMHIAGVHHDGDSERTSFGDSLGTLGLLTLVLGLALQLFTRKTVHLAPTGASPVQAPCRTDYGGSFERKTQTLRC